MKTSLICGAALAILGVAAAPLIAQTQTTTSSSSTGYVQTSKIIGTKVKASNGEEVGVVKDVVLDRSNGCMAYTVLSAGGTGSRITGQSKLVAIPWSVYTVAPDAGYLTVNVDRQRIYDAPVFEYSRISDTTYTTNVFSHFGVSTGVGIGATSTTTGATTTTGASTTTGATTQTQAGASVSPGASAAMSASASPGVSASPSASVSASASASPAASASAAASASESPRSATGGHTKTGASPSTSPHHRGGESTRQSTGTSEEGATGTSEKKSTRKATGEESTSETGASPSSKKSSKSKKGGTESETAPTPGGEQE
jgi:sporulation protein YlmC with PRC-barrel domain